VTYVNPTASDTNGGTVQVDCGSATGKHSGDLFPIGITPINCIATDTSGVSTPPTNLFNITIKDTTPPAITLIGAAIVTIEAGSTYVDAGATALDLVSGPVGVTKSNNIVPNVPGTYTVTYTAVDAAGNTGTKTRTVIVRDSTAPVVTVNAPTAMIEGNTIGGATVTFTPTAVDAISGTLTPTCTPASGSLFPVGTTSVSCSATDASGNTGTGTGSIKVVDTKPPVVTRNGPATVTVEAGTAYTDAGATAVDIVSGNVAVTVAGTVNTSAIGSYTLTYSAKDAANNTGTATRTVTVVDTQAPVISDSANPAVLLWSPNKVMTPVTISGTIKDATLVKTTFAVVDEYKKVQPSGTVTVAANGTFSFVVSLEAYRDGSDADGRVYTVKVTATDAGNRSTTVSTIVLVPHNQ